MFVLAFGPQHAHRVRGELELAQSTAEGSSLRTQNCQSNALLATHVSNGQVSYDPRPGRVDNHGANGGRVDQCDFVSVRNDHLERSLAGVTLGRLGDNLAN
jgi:hypothetical protein